MCVSAHPVLAAMLQNETARVTLEAAVAAEEAAWLGSHKEMKASVASLQAEFDSTEAALERAKVRAQFPAHAQPWPCVCATCHGVHCAPSTVACAREARGPR